MLCHFSIKVYTKYYGLSFAYDALESWKDLPDDAFSATSLHLFRNKIKAYLFVQAYPL